MVRPGWPGDGTPSIESLRELRLRAFFNDLVKDVGPGKLAEQFGVDRKTLWRWQRAAELPPRLAEALERMLLERAVAAMEADRKRVGALEERVGELERQLAAVNDVVLNGAHVDKEVIDVTDALRQEFAQELQRLERHWVGLHRRRAGAMPPAPVRRPRGPGSSGATTTWLPGIRPTMMSRSTAPPGPWWRSGGSCGRGTRPRARDWPGRRGENGYWNWRSPCWTTTGLPCRRRRRPWEGWTGGSSGPAGIGNWSGSGGGGPGWNC